MKNRLTNMTAKVKEIETFSVRENDKLRYLIDNKLQGDQK